jgi:hypothetical protein
MMTMMVMIVVVSETEFHSTWTWLTAHRDITTEHTDLIALSFVTRCTEIN